MQKPKTMFCGKCGTQLSDTDKFCPRCGEKVLQIPEVNDVPANNQSNVKPEPVVFSETEGPSNPWKWVAITLIAVLVIGGGAYWIFNTMSKNTSKHFSVTTDSTQVTDIDSEDSQPEEISTNEEDLSASTFSQQTKAANARTVYYVVVASYDNKGEAESYVRNMPDGLESPVYKAFAKGKTVYRVCCGCYTNKAEAQSLVSLLANNYYMKSWIWQGNTNEECVYRPIGLSGNPVDISPSETYENEHYVYSSAYDGYVNIRSAASANSRILGALYNGGEGAFYLGQYGKWYKVNYNGIIGYCHKDHCLIK